MTVLAEDNDAGENGRVTYSLGNSQDPLLPANAFSIQNTGGMFKAKTIDREAVEKFMVAIVAIDNGITIKNTASATATIFIDDVNDNSPSFDPTLYKITIKETFVGNVLQVYATDKDVESHLVYSVGSNSFDHFGMDQNGDKAFLHVHNVSLAVVAIYIYTLILLIQSYSYLDTSISTSL